VINPSHVLPALPKALREELLKSYQQIMSNYLERRWEPSELNGGKFCEATYSIISGAIKGSFPAKASKPGDMLSASRALEKETPDPNRVGDRSLRILIPRVLPVCAVLSSGVRNYDDAFSRRIVSPYSPP